MGVGHAGYLVSLLALLSKNYSRNYAIQLRRDLSTNEFWFGVHNFPSQLSTTPSWELPMDVFHPSIHKIFDMQVVASTVDCWLTTISRADWRVAASAEWVLSKIRELLQPRLKVEDVWDRQMVRNIELSDTRLLLANCGFKFQRMRLARTKAIINGSPLRSTGNLAGAVRHRERMCPPV